MPRHRAQRSNSQILAETTAGVVLSAGSVHAPQADLARTSSTAPGTYARHPGRSWSRYCEAECWCMKGHRYRMQVPQCCPCLNYGARRLAGWVRSASGRLVLGRQNSASPDLTPSAGRDRAELFPWLGQPAGLSCHDYYPATRRLERYPVNTRTPLTRAESCSFLSIAASW